MKLGLIIYSALVVLTITSCSQPRGTNLSSSVLKETNEATFERDVIDSKVPVLVDFYASWCQPCRKMEPVLENLASMYRNKVKVIRVNVENEPKLAHRYRITAIPHLMLFKNGDLVDDVLGMTSLERLSYSLERVL